MQGAQPAPVAATGTGTGTEAAAVDDAPDYGFELQLAERDLFVAGTPQHNAPAPPPLTVSAAALFKRLAFEHNCLNEIVTNKSFPEAVAQSVLGQFRAFEEVRFARISSWVLQAASSSEAQVVGVEAVRGCHL